MSRSKGPFGLVFDILAIIQGMFVLFAATFLASAAAQTEPMLPAMYGRAVDYPATWWASWFLLGHGAAMVGMWSGWTRLAAAGIMFVTPAYFLLAVFSLPAAFGSIITLHSIIIGAPVQLLTLAVVVLFGSSDDER